MYVDVGGGGGGVDESKTKHTQLIHLINKIAVYSHVDKSCRERGGGRKTSMCVRETVPSERERERTQTRKLNFTRIVV